MLEVRVDDFSALLLNNQGEETSSLDRAASHANTGGEDQTSQPAKQEERPCAPAAQRQGGNFKIADGVHSRRDRCNRRPQSVQSPVGARPSAVRFRRTSLAKQQAFTRLGNRVRAYRDRPAAHGGKRVQFLDQ